MLIEHNPQFLAQLKRHEGKVVTKSGQHKAYLCPAKYWTIGYGHNLDANPIPDLNKDSRINEERAEKILLVDCSAFAQKLDLHLPWWRGIGEERSAVLLNMAFNMGVYARDSRGRVRGLCSFKKMLSAVQNEDWQGARNEMLSSSWASQVGRRAVELSKQMLTGKWQREIPKHFYQED